MSTTDDGYTRPGVGLISVGWMGKLHSRAYQAVPQVYPELKIRPRQSRSSFICSKFQTAEPSVP